jgi:hypothetical protein
VNATCCRRWQRGCQTIEADPGQALDALDATIRERVFKRIRAAQGLTTIQANEGEWLPFSPKVSIKVLRRDGETQSYLLRLEAGAVVLPHVHGHDEMQGERGAHGPVVSKARITWRPRRGAPIPTPARCCSCAARPLPGRCAGAARRCMR